VEALRRARAQAQAAREAAEVQKTQSETARNISQIQPQPAQPEAI